MKPKRRSSLRRLIGSDGELRFPIDTDPRKDKPVLSPRMIWRLGRFITMLILLVIVLFYQWFVKQQRDFDDENYLKFTDEIVIDARGEWQNSRLIAEPGDILIVEYVSGKWKSFEQEGMKGPSGGWICKPGEAEVECDQIMQGFPWSVLIGRVGETAPFAAGEYVRRAVATGGMIELRINDTGMNDNAGSITVKITLLRTPPTSTVPASPTPTLNIQMQGASTPLPPTWTPQP